MRFEKFRSILEYNRKNQNDIAAKVRDFYFQMNMNYEKDLLNLMMVVKPLFNKILTTIIDKFKGGPVGIGTIATAVGEDAGTLEEVYEPFLIKEGFIHRTPRGREVTELAYKHLGLSKYKYDDNTLF